MREYAAIVEIARVIRFYSRLPLPRLRTEAEDFAMPDFARSPWAIAVVGTLIAAIGAIAGGIALLAGLSPLIAAALTIAALVIVTGCFHEDGLADTCDGLWGGASTERRLEIMKDSRIGTYGATALGLSLVLRIGALAELYRILGPQAGLLVLGMGGLSRILALVPTLVLSPARSGGLAAQNPMPQPLPLLFALVIALAIMGIVLFYLALLPVLPIAAAMCGLMLVLLIRIMRTKINGFTGDTLGASQQVFEIGLLLVFSAAT